MSVEERRGGVSVFDKKTLENKKTNLNLKCFSLGPRPTANTGRQETVNYLLTKIPAELEE